MTAMMADEHRSGGSVAPRYCDGWSGGLSSSLGPSHPEAAARKEQPSYQCLGGKRSDQRPGVGNERDYLHLGSTPTSKGSASKILWINRAHDALRRRANSAVVSGDLSVSATVGCCWCLACRDRALLASAHERFAHYAELDIMPQIPRCRFGRCLDWRLPRATTVCCFQDKGTRSSQPVTELQESGFYTPSAAV